LKSFFAAVLKTYLSLLQAEVLHSLSYSTIHLCSAWRRPLVGRWRLLRCQL
jgi:hypothetical protein